MPVGQYRTHRSPSQRAHRGSGNSYVESPATMEKAFAAALELGRRRLVVQREEIKQTASVRRGSAGPAAVGKDIVGSRGL